MSNAATYYTVVDERFFPGVVGLLNSLRLTGNTGELVVLDCGLAPHQRDRLAHHATLVEQPENVRSNPYLIKPFPCLLQPKGVVVLIDSDVIVTRSLDPVVAAAAEGKICIYPEVDGSVVRDRWFAEWAQLFELEQPLRHERYRAAGFVVLSTERWPRLLERWWTLAERIPSDRTMQRGAAFSDPFWGADMDALNALLMSEVPADAVVELPFAESAREWWLRQVKVVDSRTLECRLGGTSPMMLHYLGRPKPWQPRAWMRVRGTAFERLMTRVLFSADAPLRLRPREVPIWLRDGVYPRLVLRSLALLNSTARVVVHGLSGRTRSRLTALRDRLGG